MDGARFSLTPLREYLKRELLDELEKARTGREHPDPVVSRAWALRFGAIHREIALRNARETAEQDALSATAAPQPEVDPCG